VVKSQARREVWGGSQGDLEQEAIKILPTPERGGLCLSIGPPGASESPPAPEAGAFWGSLDLFPRGREFP